MVVMIMVLTSILIALAMGMGLILGEVVQLIKARRDLKATEKELTPYLYEAGWALHHLNREKRIERWEQTGTYR